MQFAADGGGGDHRSVICTQAAVGHAKADAFFVAVVLQARTEPAVGTYASAHYKRLHAGLL